jgi:hypothetical protein
VGVNSAYSTDFESENSSGAFKVKAFVANVYSTFNPNTLHKELRMPTLDAYPFEALPGETIQVKGRNLATAKFFWSGSNTPIKIRKFIPNPDKNRDLDSVILKLASEDFGSKQLLAAINDANFGVLRVISNKAIKQHLLTRLQLTTIT